MAATEATGELMEWLKTSAEKGGDFLAEQAPIYAQEVVAWQFWASVTVATFLFIGAFICAVFYRRAYRWCLAAIEESSHNPNPLPFIAAAILFMAGCGFLAGTFGNIYCAVQAKVAPRMVIIEHVRGLAK